MYTMRREALVCLILAVSILAVYWQGKDHKFVDYDDKAWVGPSLQLGPEIGILSPGSPT